MDIYSCGVSLFAMLTGFFPVDEATRDDWRFLKLQTAQLAGMDTVGTIMQWCGRAPPRSTATAATTTATTAAATAAMR